MIISPSVASGDVINIQNEVEYVDRHFSNLHIDIQDGVYAKITFGMKALAAITKIAKSKISVHLQVMNPLGYLESISKMDGIDVVHIHVDHIENPADAIKAFQNKGIHVGIALSDRDFNSDTHKYFNMVDSVLVLTALSRDPAQEYSLVMEEYVRRIIRDTSLHVWVDGGIGLHQLEHLKEMGVYAVVLGRAVFGDKKAAKSIYEK